MEVSQECSTIFVHVDQDFCIFSVTIAFLQHQRDSTFHRRISTVTIRTGTQITSKFERNWPGFEERLGRLEVSRQERCSFGRSERHSLIGPWQIFGEVPGSYHLPKLVEVIGEKDNGICNPP
jgi:hypothetical protein